MSATPAIEAAPNRRTIRSPVTAVPHPDSASSSTAPPSSFRPVRSRVVQRPRLPGMAIGPGGQQPEADEAKGDRIKHGQVPWTGATGRGFGGGAGADPGGDGKADADGQTGQVEGDEQLVAVEQRGTSQREVVSALTMGIAAQKAAAIPNSMVQARRAGRPSCANASRPQVQNIADTSISARPSSVAGISRLARR